jgi:hypothetical protein
MNTRIPQELGKIPLAQTFGMLLWLEVSGKRFELVLEGLGWFTIRESGNRWFW